MTDNFFDRNGTIQQMSNVASSIVGSKNQNSGWFSRFGNAILGLLSFIL